MEILSKGYKVPDIDDKAFWDAIDYDIRRLNDHDHDGINSQKLKAGAVDVYAVLVEVADWVGASAPWYFDIPFPTGYGLIWDGSVCPVQIVVRNEDGDVVHLSQEPTVYNLGVRLITYVKADLTVGMY